MADLLAMPFMQRALAAAALAGILGGLLGVFLVQRRLSFLAAGVSHGSFAGIGLGLFLGLAPFAVAIPAALAIGLAIAFLRRSGALPEDTVVGILFAAGMAAGVLLLSLSGANASLSAYLFGSILAIGGRDLMLLAGITAAVAAFLLAAWGRLTLVTFDRQLAMASGIPVRALDYGFFAGAALAIVAAVKLVGVVLVASFFVVPAATARLLGRTFLGVTLLAVALGVATAVGGLLLAYPVEAPVGALIVLLQAGLFAAVLGIRGRPGQA
ncbi:MAG TPA: metal ABC transporter permease [Gammaproteobacteria bacterium]|nr:metal ABC transporter permease [Gammaproteobacteria bacterium]